MNIFSANCFRRGIIPEPRLKSKNTAINLDSYSNCSDSKLIMRCCLEILAVTTESLGLSLEYPELNIDAG